MVHFIHPDDVFEYETVSTLQLYAQEAVYLGRACCSTYAMGGDCGCHGDPDLPDAAEMRLDPMPPPSMAAVPAVVSDDDIPF